jgi:hypothetical protein
MTNNTPKNYAGISKTNARIKIAFFLAFLFFFCLGLTKGCFGYVSPDWKAQERANERQKPRTQPVEVNTVKQDRNNEKQEIHSKKVKVNKILTRRRKKQQEFNGKSYKYDRSAEQRRNALQKP